MKAVLLGACLKGDMFLKLCLALTEYSEPILLRLIATRIAAPDRPHGLSCQP